MKNVTLFFISFVILFSVNFAQKDSQFEILKNKFLSAKDFSVDFSVGKKLGNYFYKVGMPEKIKFGAVQILIDTDTLITFNSNSNKLIYSIRDTKLIPYSFVNIFSDLTSKSKVKEFPEQNLIIIISDSDENFDEIQIFLNNKNLPDRILMKQSNQEIELEIDKIQFDNNLNDDIFLLKTNKQTKVIDLR